MDKLAGICAAALVLLLGAQRVCSVNLMVIRWSGSHGVPPGQPHSAGAFKSSDGGLIWQECGTVIDEFPYDDIGLDVAAAPSGILYCLLWDRDHVATVYKSADEGLSWEAEGVVKDTFSSWDAASAGLVCLSQDSLYALLWSRDVTDGCEMFESCDGGSTWSLRSRFAGNVSGQDKDLGFAVDGSRVFFALMWNSGDYPRVYGSLDGTDWAELGVVDSIQGDEGYCAASLASLGNDTLVAGLWSSPPGLSAPLLSYHSADGGLTWEEGDTVVQAVVDDGSFCVSEGGAGEVYAVAWTNHLKASCYRSLDAGESWTYRGEIFSTLPYSWSAGIAIAAYSRPEGVGELRASQVARIRVRVERNRIRVENAESDVHVYSVVGRRVAILAPAGGSAEFTADRSGVYFISTGSETHKAVLIR